MDYIHSHISDCFYSFHHLTVSRKREFSIQYSVPLLTKTRKNTRLHQTESNETTTTLYILAQYFITTKNIFSASNFTNWLAAILRIMLCVGQKCRNVLRNVETSRLVYTNVFISANDDIPIYHLLYLSKSVASCYQLTARSLSTTKKICTYYWYIHFCASHLLSIWIGSIN